MPVQPVKTGVAAVLSVKCCANEMKRVGFGDLCLAFATTCL